LRGARFESPKSLSQISEGQFWLGFRKLEIYEPNAERKEGAGVLVGGCGGDCALKGVIGGRHPDVVRYLAGKSIWGHILGGEGTDNSFQGRK